MASRTGKSIGTIAGTGLGAIFGPAGAGIGASLGGAIGGLFDSDDSEKYLKQALAQYEGIIPPDLAEAIVYAQYQQGGQLTPQQLQALPIEAQEAIKLVESPEMRQKQEVQRQALEQLSRTGMGPQELLSLEKVRRTTAADAQAQLSSLMNKYQQMGQAGGGASLAASLQAGQAASDRASMDAMAASAQAAENRRSAIKQAYDAASGMRASDLSVAERNMENQRRKQEFDIQNAIARQQANARYAQEANMANLQRQQSVMDKNVAQRNEEAYRRGHVAKQQMYQNQLGLAKAKADVYGSNPLTSGREAATAEAKNWQNVIGGVSDAFGEMEDARIAKKKDPWSWS